DHRERDGQPPRPAGRSRLSGAEPGQPPSLPNPRWLAATRRFRRRPTTGRLTCLRRVSVPDGLVGGGEPRGAGADLRPVQGRALVGRDGGRRAQAQGDTHAEGSNHREPPDPATKPACAHDRSFPRHDGAHLALPQIVPWHWTTWKQPRPHSSKRFASYPPVDSG